MCKLVKWNNENHIADIKYNHIVNITKQAKKCKNINRIMLFGSSLEERCTARSDIDIAVFGNQSKASYLRSKEFREFRNQVFLYDLNQDYDILYFTDGKQQEDQIMKDIDKGVEIFRREAV